MGKDNNTDSVENDKIVGAAPEIEEDNKKSSFWAKNKISIFLVFIILAVFIGATIQMNIMDKRFEKEKKEIVQKYTQEIDSINITTIEKSSQIFSWAVRNEFMKKDMNAINQLFLEYSRINNILKINLIETETLKILASTDKQDEGAIFPNFPLTIKKPILLTEDSFIRTINPITGANNKLISVLAIDYKK